MERRNRIYLIRHGQVEGFEHTPIYGSTDVDLTAVGRRQLSRTAERLRLVDLRAIYSSDLKRALVGADLLALDHAVPVRRLPELREMSFGQWEGLALSALQAQHPEELRKRQADLLHYRPPGGGESIEDFARRITECFRAILDTSERGDLAIVSHAGVNRVILCYALGLDYTRMFSIHQDYACLNIVDVFAKEFIVRQVNG